MSEKDFSTNQSGLDSPAKFHEALALGTLRAFTADEIPRAIRADADGIIIMKDADGTAVTYNVLKGEILPIRATEITTGTTIATQILW